MTIETPERELSASANLAHQLAAARDKGTTLSPVGVPDTLEQAYALQQQVNEASGATITGFKIGATLPATMDALQVHEPVFGALYDRYTHTLGDTIAIHAAHNAKIETEFVVCLSAALHASKRHITLDDVTQATAWVAGGFEIIGSRFTGQPLGVKLVSDAGGNIDFLYGQPYTDWQSLNLDNHGATLTINGEFVASGHSGMSIAGNPLGMVAWLANHPQLQPRGLIAGDMITCGTCTGLIPVKAGDQVCADFGELGIVSTTFEDAASADNPD